MVPAARCSAAGAKAARRASLGLSDGHRRDLLTFIWSITPRRGAEHCRLDGVEAANRKGARLCHRGRGPSWKGFEETIDRRRRMEKPIRATSSGPTGKPARRRSRPLSAIPWCSSPAEVDRVQGGGGADFIHKVYEADPLECRKANGRCALIAALIGFPFSIVRHILEHLGCSIPTCAAPRPAMQAGRVAGHAVFSSLTILFPTARRDRAKPPGAL